VAIKIRTLFPLVRLSFKHFSSRVWIWPCPTWRCWRRCCQPISSRFRGIGSFKFRL